MEGIFVKLKYRKEIEELISQGILLPDNLIIPNNQKAFRWVFDSNNPKNHIPVYMQNPQRLLKEMRQKCLNTDGYALSCFENELNAEKRFQSFTRSHPNFWKTVGNSISMGLLQESDGRTTMASESGHFDLYEFVECNLGDKFVITKKLI